ncbi:MAG: hypothetical protein sL5_10480 [Candidatus Mesenet longicola]|uniref:Tc1-like transposase DDE domain-containing protein n=1 Tax=Candidatus Mesenet longicola TaxID=1892558 RepID=A0A8J3HW82_9RICK|nr:MAG: hypothetical protein sGL2_03770 [Candidatus Mesenet longicola]GHM60055.1 MAG: hypothetical protein sL5_10480 [Candidatus Mesenet longicola]
MIIEIDNKLYREYSTRREANIPGKKRQKISMIGNWIGRRFVASMTFIGGCDKEVFNTWLEQILLPLLAQL